ncbi:MAG: hypothetical protein PHI59_08295 [Candidatus Omnitrophica bacterium]|nr:hypothetical protein [Candidatus Omnitrophota bacterium]
MKEKIVVISVILTMGFCSISFADTIYLKNGGRVEGKITSESGDKVVIKTEISTMSINRDRIDKIESDTGKIEDQNDKPAVVTEDRDQAINISPPETQPKRPAAPVTVDEIIARVAANDSLIKDVKADIDIKSDAPWQSPESHGKIWIKGNKQKIQEISPKPGVYVRPRMGMLKSGDLSFKQEIISHDPETNMYAIKSKKTGQIKECPYIVHYVDFDKGVVVKIEYHKEQDNFRTTSVSEYSDFVRKDNAWGYMKQVDKMYGRDNELLNTTTMTYSNVQLNTGIPDSEFAAK